MNSKIAKFNCIKPENSIAICLCISKNLDVSKSHDL